MANRRRSFSIRQFDEKFKRSSQTVIKNAIAEFVGLPLPLQQAKKKVDILAQFNDPKGQYLYCINCGDYSVDYKDYMLSAVFFN